MLAALFEIALRLTLKNRSIRVDHKITICAYAFV